MRTLGTTCPRCGTPLDLPPAAVLLSAGATGTLGWAVCTGCDDVVAVPVPEPAVAALLRAGGHVLGTGGVAHPEPRPTSTRALDVEDVVALHALLGDDDALAEAVRELDA